MSTLVTMFVAHCEACGEELLFSPEDLKELQDGDILSCGSCFADLEVVKTPSGLELHRHVYLTICPKCNEEFELSDEMLNKSIALCSHCNYKFQLQWDEE